MAHYRSSLLWLFCLAYFVCLTSARKKKPLPSRRHRGLLAECGTANAPASPLFLGASNATSLDLLHRALNNWKNCQGTVYFTGLAAGATYVLAGGYQPNGGITLDASALDKPVRLMHRSGNPNVPGLLNFIKAASGPQPTLVARNIDFVDSVRSALNSVNGTLLSGNVIIMAAGTAAFESCRFLNNSVVHRTTGWGACGGGALRLSGLTSTRFDDCVFEKNTATCEGRTGSAGAVWLQDPLGPTEFNRCRFTGNRLLTTITMEGPKPAALGGAVFVESNLKTSASIAFTKCAFVGNQVQGWTTIPATASPIGQLVHVAGGAVSMDPFRLSLLDLIYTDCLFEGNTVTGYANTSSTGVLNVQGGAVAHTSGSAAFSACNFESNEAATSSFSKASSSNGIRTSGGALYLNSVAATIDASNFKDNSALAATDARGGAVGIQATFGPSSTFIKSTTWVSNKALANGEYGRGAYGGGLGATCQPGSSTRTCQLSVLSCVLKDNSATLMGTTVSTTSYAQGGGMYLSGVTKQLNLFTSHFEGSLAFGKAGSLTSPLFVGGAGMYLVDTSASVISTVFTVNTAWIDEGSSPQSQVMGGGLTIATATAATPSMVSLESAKFVGNTVGGVDRNVGGALYKDLASRLTDTNTEVVAMLDDGGTVDKSFNDWILEMTPTVRPTRSPSLAPSSAPSSTPTEQPSRSPTEQATLAPSHVETTAPTVNPSPSPSSAPSSSPTSIPTGVVSAAPSSSGPSSAPVAHSATWSSSPSSSPSATPSASPSLSTPSASPTDYLANETTTTTATTSPTPVNNVTFAMLSDADYTKAPTSARNLTEAPTSAENKCEVVWGDWTPCSAACGPGEQSQSGTSKGGVKDCPETSTRFQACELRPCVSSIFIVSGAAGDKKDAVNPNSKVVLGFDVTSLSSYDGLQFAWSGGGNGLDLDLVNESGDLPSWLASPATNKALVFNPGALAAGSIYTFAATVSNTFGMSSTTQFVLRVNNPPTGGALAVTPSKGYALKTAFRLLASGWTDDEGDYPLTYTFSADETLTLQSASPADSYRGVLAAPASDDAKSRFVQLTCIVQDSLGAKSVVSAWVELAPNPTEGTDPLGFLESQLEAVQELLGGQKDGAPGAASMTLALLTLLHCVDMLNSEAATSVAAFTNGVKMEKSMQILGLVHDLSSSLDGWSSSTATEAGKSALVNALTTLTSIVYRLATVLPGEVPLAHQGITLDALSKMVSAATRTQASMTPESKGQVLTMLSSVVLSLSGQQVPAIVRGILAGLHQSTVAAMALGEPAAMTTSRNIDVASYVFAVDSVATQVLTLGEGKSKGRRMRELSEGDTARLFSVAVPSQLGAKVQELALAAGASCNAQGSIQAVVWKLNPYEAEAQGLLNGATPDTVVVDLAVWSCAWSAPALVTGLVPTEGLVEVTFPAFTVNRDALAAYASLKQDTVMSVHCTKDVRSSQPIQCPILEGFGGGNGSGAMYTEGPVTVESLKDGFYAVSCSGASGALAQFTCPRPVMRANCLFWNDGVAGQGEWSTQGCQVVSTNADSVSFAQPDVLTTCSCAQTGTLATTVTPGVSAIGISLLEDPTTGGRFGDEGASDGDRAGSLLIIAVTLLQVAAFLVALVLSSRLGDQHVTKNTKLLLQSRGAQHLMAAALAEKARAGGDKTVKESAEAAEGPMQYIGPCELHQIDKVYDAAYHREAFFSSMEASSTLQRLRGAMAFTEFGVFLTPRWLLQSMGVQHSSAVLDSGDATRTMAGTSGGGSGGTFRDDCEKTIRPLSSNPNSSSDREAPQSVIQASLLETKLRQLNLQKVVIFAVKHFMILVICMGRFQPSTEQFGQWQLRDCDGDSPMKACLQPGQFIVRNILQLMVLLPTLLLLYILLPVALRRPRKQDQAWLRIWHNRALALVASQDHGAESALSARQLATHSSARLCAIAAELDVLHETLASARDPDVESLEAVDELRRSVASAAWSKRVAGMTTCPQFWTRHATNAYISPIVDNGSEDALKTYDQLVLTSLMGGARRERSFRQLLMALFYRLSLFDAMEDEVESEQAFASAGLATVLSFGGLFVLFLVCAVWYIVDTALGWRFTSALVPLIYYLESVFFIMAFVSPLSVYLKCVSEQVLAGALVYDLHKLRHNIKEFRQVRAGTDIAAPSAPDQSLAMTGSVHSPFMSPNDGGGDVGTEDPYARKMRDAGTGSLSNLEGTYRAPTAPMSLNPTQQRQGQEQEPGSPQDHQRKGMWSVRNGDHGFSRANDDIQRQHDRDMI